MRSLEVTYRLFTFITTKEIAVINLHFAPFVSANSAINDILQNLGDLPFSVWSCSWQLGMRGINSIKWVIKHARSRLRMPKFKVRFVWLKIQLDKSDFEPHT